MKYIFLLSFSLTLILSPSLSYCEKNILRCEQSKIIRPGDYKAAVLEKCGEPFFREENNEVYQWAYKVGPRRKIWVIIFKDGKVEKIEDSRREHRDGIGKSQKKRYVASDFKKIRCDKQIIRLGDYKASVLDSCGEPFFREKNLLIDQWSYLFGPEKTLYVIGFDEGKVIAINKGKKRKSKDSLSGHR